MATYEYKCLNPHCGKVFTKYGVPMAKSSEPATCPECATRAPRSLSADVGIIIK